ncbi:hypothetical protein SODALDRAFT_356686 [Sodiomyces alkalinus F11]|uniref:Uncharacterized protein n=1 Tax=Sodiomyces alkalinus (strain CBS 110278 / VKM F-3762 / F11) TaxID=1314773 RepID=A0A3N2Q232_SODAK|nr:hypothetical protein SODALDRAFT_356686 [Sodiomyces alkalinus F11]ROT40675.1 hypothetical protein SODALDRAFT_356686 [Sodiomyces alkalinus F11]
MVAHVILSVADDHSHTHGSSQAAIQNIAIRVMTGGQKRKLSMPFIFIISMEDLMHPSVMFE